MAIPSNLPKNAPTPWILWVALLMAQITMAAVGFVVRRDSSGDFSSEGISLILPLGLVASLAGLASLFINFVLIQPEKMRDWARESREKGENFDRAQGALLQRYYPRMVVACALAESVTIFGFVLFFLRQISPTYFFAFVGVGLALHLFCYPKLSQVREALDSEYPPGARNSGRDPAMVRS